ncbi:acid protease [Auriscalpium vulgare]|uniref:Acid protease n=1 Tax=Auriscalpium vulgare TaxID=40419 RepID=A0ACB8RR77_9AGAM|nr:acid protease [Auriscalpium vulgare]
MVAQLSLVPISLCALALGAAASPVRDADSPRRARTMQIRNRRSFVQGPPVQGDDENNLFDPTAVQPDLQAIIAKYQFAGEYLQGVNLSPDDTLDMANNYTRTVNTTIPAGAFAASDVMPAGNVTSTDVDDGTPDGDSDPDGDARAPPTAPPFLPAVSGRPSGTGVQPLRDYIEGTLDLLYYGPVDVGTPKQTLTVDVDTGSADLWLPVGCTNDPRGFCPEHSSTYEPSDESFQVTYGSGEVSGKLVNDTVTIAGMTVARQAFGAVDQESNQFQDDPNNGLIGMAFGTIATSRQPTFFENLIKQRSLDQPMFSVHLARQRSVGSEVCFGCIDSSKTTGPVTWVPVKSKVSLPRVCGVHCTEVALQTYWAVGMDAVYANGRRTAANVFAAIDTGTTLIYLPNKLAKAFYDTIPGAKPAPEYGSGFYTYPCAKTVIELSFAGHRFKIDPSDFNLGHTKKGSSDCVGGILAIGDQLPANLAIVGDEFLKSWYSTYDYSHGARVGFSPDINNQQ